MSIWLVVTLCGLLVVLGVALLLKRPMQPRSSHGRTVPRASDQPLTYILRIAGAMVAAFGLALGLMATVFHFT